MRITGESFLVDTSDRRDTYADELQRLRDIYGNGAFLHSRNRVIHPDVDPREACVWAGDRVKEAKDSGKFTALVAGGFDVPHDAHEWYLRNCRRMVAERMLQDRDEESTVESVRRAIASEDIFLVVSIDSDQALSDRKSGRPEKGDILRPVYPWQSRADRIAGYSFETVDGRYRPTVDLVLKEGVEYAGYPLGCTYDFADYLTGQGLLDAYLTYDEHDEDIQAAKKLGFDPIILSQDLLYAVDPRTGQRYSSSAIIKKIREGVE